MTTSTNIHSLPREILFEVFSYLNPTFLCETVSKVCVNWKDACEDPLLYKTFEFKVGEVSTETTIKLLRRAPLLKELRLVDQKDLNRVLEQVWQFNHQMGVFDLDRSGSYYEPTSIKLSIMKEITQNCSNLHTLKLKGYYVCGEVFYKSLVNLPHLRTVHLIDGGKHSYRAVSHLLNSSLGLEDLQIYDEKMLMVCIREHTLYDKEIIALCERFSKTLRCLALQYGAWSANAFNALRKCDHLKKLSIYNPDRPSVSGTGLLDIGLMVNLCHLRGIENNRRNIFHSQVPVVCIWHLNESCVSSRLDFLRIHEEGVRNLAARTFKSCVYPVQDW